MTGPGLHLDELTVGQRFVSGMHAIDASQVIRFASEYDPQPFHLDPAAAESSVFGELVASGWHTAAITMRLLVDGQWIAGGLIGFGGAIRWPGPTRPGDVLRVHSEVIEITPSRSRPNRGVVTLRSETRNQRGEVVQVLDAKLLVPRRAGGAPQHPPEEVHDQA